jgi:signal transduction histidine kinase
MEAVPGTWATSRFSRANRLWLCVLIAVCHVIVFLFLRKTAGETAAAITPVSVGLIGWLLGLKGGLAAGMLAVPVNLLLFHATGFGFLHSFQTLWPSAFFGLITGQVAGLLSDLLDSVNQKSAELRHEQESLKLETAERERAEAALRDSEESLRNIFHGINDGVIIAALSGEIVDVNHKFLEIYGVTKEHVVGAQVSALCQRTAGVSPADDGEGRRDACGTRDEWPRALEKIRAGEHALLEWQCQRGEGARFHVELHARKLRLKNQEVVLVTIHDISERKRAEEGLKESYRELKETQAQLVQAGKMVAIGQLATGVAHEINNPLAVISSSAEILDASLPPAPPERQQLLSKHMKRILDNIDRCKGITQTLLQFARKEKDPLELVDMHELAVSALKFARSSERAAGRQLRYSQTIQSRATVVPVTDSSSRLSAMSAQTPLYVRGYTRQLQQVVLNLLLNALDAMEEGGCVTLALEPREGGLALSVTDDGRGIPPEHQEHLFEPFFTTKPAGKGTGLGLYLTHSIVVAHKGTITVETQPGKGTCVKVCLPLADTPQPVAPASVPAVVTGVPARPTGTEAGATTEAAR